MFGRLRIGKKVELTPEQIKRKLDAEKEQLKAREELREAKELATALRVIRERNHFAEGFRKSFRGSQ